MFAAFMDLEKANDRMDKQGLQKVLRIYYVVDGKLLRAVKSMDEEAKVKCEWRMS